MHNCQLHQLVDYFSLKSQLCLIVECCECQIAEDAEYEAEEDVIDVFDSDFDEDVSNLLLS